MQQILSCSRGRLECHLSTTMTTLNPDVESSWPRYELQLDSTQHNHTGLGWRQVREISGRFSRWKRDFSTSTAITTSCTCPLVADLGVCVIQSSVFTTKTLGVQHQIQDALVVLVDQLNLVLHLFLSLISLVLQFSSCWSCPSVNNQVIVVDEASLLATLDIS